ncbi:hypothetical protein Fcan01_15501 [Folsomia candida]|uniref:Uncharacterized protein n=1 Tax=Folsomia candida TaxID=158441 RepID=A0A226DWI2_FOLCA|nr:hypothetical protein Fcan01_15501 [Folsomia candida]
MSVKHFTFVFFISFFFEIVHSDIVSNSLQDVAEIFGLCVTIVVKPFKEYPLTPSQPVLIYDPPIPAITNETSERPPDYDFLFTQISFVMRQQNPEFCWAYIFPEIGYRLRDQHFLYSPLFPRYFGSVTRVYFVWIVSQFGQEGKQEIRKIKRMLFHIDLNVMGTREFLIYRRDKIYHLNRYHGADYPTSDLDFRRYTAIPCNHDSPSETFTEIRSVADFCSLELSKYHWTYMEWIDITLDGYEFAPEFLRMHEKYFRREKNPAWFEVANASQSLQDFISYKILSDTFYNLSITRDINYRYRYKYFGKGRLRFNYGNHQIFWLGRHTCSFLSCYGIQQSTYAVFSTPLDKSTWICISCVAIALQLLCSLVKANPKRPFKWMILDLDVAILVCATLLEVSCIERIKRVIPSRLWPIMWLWILCSLVITAFYKEIFTSDVVHPFVRTPTWNYIYDLDKLGFKFFFAADYKVQIYEDMYANGTPPSLLAWRFAADLQTATAYEGNLTRLNGYKRVAQALVNGDVNVGRRDLTGNQTGITPRIWQALHHKWPLHLYPNISKCHDKLVYMDATEHIPEILDYLNDNRDGIVFMKGSDDEFLLTYFGIQIDPY